MAVMSPEPPTATPGCGESVAKDGRVPTARPLSAGLFRALSDPLRLEILALIGSRPVPICVCDIVGRFDVTQPTISHHLKVLRDAGLVTSFRRGRWSYYSPDPDGAAAVRSAVDFVLPERQTDAR